jgi:hypothetical protein
MDIITDINMVSIETLPAKVKTTYQAIYDILEKSN